MFIEKNICLQKNVGASALGILPGSANQISARVSFSCINVVEKNIGEPISKENFEIILQSVKCS